MVEAIGLLLRNLMDLIHFLLVPLGCVVAWSLVLLTLWQLVALTRDGLQRARIMHQIPCAQCRYFTHSPLLKCPVHPRTALSEAAIGCADYETTAYLTGR
ncbi:MAG: hypothetical protein ACKO5P_09990 [Nodosilinea sp.]